jgi:hypothetical protein
MLCEPNINYRIEKSPPVAPVLSQINLLHTLPFYFFKVNCKIIFSFYG